MDVHSSVDVHWVLMYPLHLRMWYCMRFNFHGVYISQICNFCGFRVFIFVVAGYSGVEVFMDIRSESVIVYGNCRGAKLARLAGGFT